MNALGRFLVDARRERGWSSAELARRSGITSAQISRLEDPERADPDPHLSTLRKLAAALEVTLDEIVRAIYPRNFKQRIHAAGPTEDEEWPDPLLGIARHLAGLDAALQLLLDSPELSENLRGQMRQVLLPARSA